MKQNLGVPIVSLKNEDRQGACSSVSKMTLFLLLRVSLCFSITYNANYAIVLVICLLRFLSFIQKLFQKLFYYRNRIM